MQYQMAHDQNATFLAQQQIAADQNKYAIAANVQISANNSLVQTAISENQTQVQLAGLNTQQAIALANTDAQVKIAQIQSSTAKKQSSNNLLGSALGAIGTIASFFL